MFEGALKWMGACKENLLAQSSPLSAASRAAHTFARSNASGVIFVTYPEATSEELCSAGGGQSRGPRGCLQALSLCRCVPYRPSHGSAWSVYKDSKHSRLSLLKRRSRKKMLIAWWYVLHFLFQLVQLKTFSFFLSNGE